MGPGLYAEALAEHRRVLRDTFAAHGGVEVDTQGDAFFVAFATAAGAVAAARSGQQALESGQIRVRMGLHTGTPTPTAAGYVGIDVHRGARVAALAHGGQVIVSASTAALVECEPLLPGLGRHRLKDFDAPAQLFQLGLPSEFPPLRTPGAVAVPTPATRFLGRERELWEAASAWLDREPRLLTIIGPGGTGQTLAIRLTSGSWPKRRTVARCSSARPRSRRSAGRAPDRRAWAPPMAVRPQSRRASGRSEPTSSSTTWNSSPA